MFVRLTNLSAYQVKASNPVDYYARKWTDVSIEEGKALCGVSMDLWLQNADTSFTWLITETAVDGSFQKVTAYHSQGLPFPGLGLVRG